MKSARILIPMLLVAASLPACVAARKCLQTPASPRISEAAVSNCESVLGTSLDRRDLFHRTVQILRVRGRYADIEQWSLKVLARDSGRTDAMYALAYALRHQGKYQKALEQYQRYASANKHDAGAYYGIALCYEGLGRRADAIKAYRDYAERETRASQRAWKAKAVARVAALGGGAALTVAAARPKLALRGAASGRRVAPPARPAPARTAPAKAAPAKAAPAKAAPAKAAPAKAAPAPARVAAAPVSCAAHRKKFKADPFATKSYAAWAACASKSGRHAEVVRYMRIAIRDNPDFAAGWLHLGNAQKALGQATQAKSSWGKACAAGVAAACNR